MRTSRPILLASAAVVLAGACNGDATAPGRDVTSPTPLNPFFTVDSTPSPADTTTWGSDPCTLDEFYCPPRPNPADTTTWRGDICTLEEARDTLYYCPPPSEPGTLSLLAPYGTTTSTYPPAESDSVVAGYGCPSTGGLEYENFEYDPETGTEYCATSDTTTAPPPPPPPPPPPSSR